MASNFESVLTTDSSGQSWNACIWDGTTGSTLATYKTGVSGQKAVALVGQSYLVSAEKEKNLIYVWALNRKEQLHMRMITQGKISCLAISNDGLYCIAGIEEKLVIWQVPTGNLLCVLSNHFQPVCCVKFNDTGSYFLSGSSDGQVLAWSLNRVLDKSQNIPEPDHIWSHHILQVTDIYVGSMHPRVITTSSDQTCRVYDFLSGELLVSFVLEVALTSVTTDSAEYHLFVGAVNGKIYQLNLYNSVAEKDIHLTEKDKEESTFLGHGKQITSLSISLDGLTLLSASYDNTARLWNIPSKQCLRILNHKGPVLNAMFISTPPYIFATEQFKASHSISQFQRQLVQTNVSNMQMINIDSRIRSSNISFSEKTVLDFDTIRNNFIKTGSDTGESKGELKSEINKMFQANQQLYCFSVGSVLDALRPKFK